MRIRVANQFSFGATSRRCDATDCLRQLPIGSSMLRFMLHCVLLRGSCQNRKSSAGLQCCRRCKICNETLKTKKNHVGAACLRVFFYLISINANQLNLFSHLEQLNILQCKYFCLCCQQSMVFRDNSYRIVHNLFNNVNFQETIKLFIVYIEIFIPAFRFIA